MCLCSSSVFPKISRKPKRVKKVLYAPPAGSGRMKTPIVCHEVKFVDGVCVIRSRVPWWKVFLCWKNYVKEEIYIRGEGVHSFDVHADVDLGAQELMYEAEIPAWTPYWVDIYGLNYASAKLVVYDKQFKL